MPVRKISLNEGDKVVLDLSIELDPAQANHQTILNHLQSGIFYEPDVTAALQRLLKPGDVFVDVGANIGFHTLIGAWMVGSSGRVISFEPGSNANEQLRHNVGLNHFDQVTVIAKAATDQVGETEFFLNSDDSGGNALWDPAIHPSNVVSRAEQKKITVPTTRLDAELPSILGEQLPKVIKIDTEGAELLVLRGAEALLAPQRVPFVICELFNFAMEQLGSDVGQMRAFMREKGYETYVLSRRGTLPVHIPHNVEIGAKYIVNALFSTDEAIPQGWPVAEYPDINY